MVFKKGGFMLEKILIIIAAAFQSQTTTVGLYALKMPFLEALILVAAGASIGITVLFYSPDAAYIAVKWIMKNVFGKEKESHRDQPLAKAASWRRKLVERIKNSKYPHVAVFLTAAVPFPGFPQIAIIAAKAMGLKSGFKAVFLGNLLNVCILVSSVYGFINLIVR